METLLQVAGNKDERTRWERSVGIVEGINKWFTMLAGVAVIFLALPLIFYVYREVRTDVLIVDPISVPKGYEEAGLTSQIMANRVGDKLQEIERSTETHMKKDVLAANPDEVAIPEVEIPGTKLGLKTLVDITRNIFKRNPKHVGGDVTLSLNDCAAVATDAPTKDRIAVTAYFVKDHVGRQSLTDTVNRGDVSVQVQKLAELALRQANPYVLGAYKEEHQEFALAESIAGAMASDQSSDKQHLVAAFNLWGSALTGEEKYEEAIGKYAKAVEIDPKFAPAYSNWGNALMGERKHEEAIAKYAKAVEIDPKFAPAYSNWCRALTGEGKYEEAILKCAKAVEIERQFPLGYYNWGVALNAKGKYAEAIEKYARTVEMDPKNANAYNDWGSALMSERNYEEAIWKYAKAVEIDPKFASAYSNWGSALMSERNYKGAIWKYAKAVEIDPKFAPAYSNWGNALMSERNYEEAIAKYAKAVEIDPKYADGYYNWGVALNAEGKYERAIAKYAKAVEIDPKYANAYFNWGIALEKLGRKKEAAEKFAIAQKIKVSR